VAKEGYCRPRPKDPKGRWVISRLRILRLLSPRHSESDSRNWIDVKTKRERELSIASEAAAERTTKEGAGYLLECLPVLDVDLDMLMEEDFRMLLEALRFEARFEPDPKRLGISVILSATIVLPGEDGVSQSLYVPPVGTERNPGQNAGGFVRAPGGIRTHTVRCLRPPSLPVGVRGPRSFPCSCLYM
jgi:hypothetical protein